MTQIIKLIINYKINYFPDLFLILILKSINERGLMNFLYNLIKLNANESYNVNFFCIKKKIKTNNKIDKCLRRFLLF